MRILPALGSTVALAAVVGGGLALHPELLDRAGPMAPTVVQPATTPAAATSGSSAARATVTSGMDPVTGKSVTGSGAAPTYTVANSLLGIPDVPGPSADLPELVLTPPGPGVEGSVTTRTRTMQLGHTSQWQAQPQVDGPVHRIVQTVADGGYVVVSTEAGQLHLLCGPGSDAYYVDSSSGQWRVYRVDGGPKYDVSYRFVQYDRSPLAQRTSCQ